MNRHPQHRIRPHLEQLEDRSLSSATALDVANAITHSFESAARYAQTDYAIFLHRAPAPAEVTGWELQVVNGLRTDLLEAVFVDSPEYHAAHQGAGAVWIDGLYRDMFGRAPAASELNGWMTQLQQGVTPAQVAVAFATSTERYAAHAVYDYEHLLGRVPGAAETAGVAGLLKAGTTDQDVVTIFVTSPEYIDIRSEGDLGIWVGNMYRDVLGRPAAPIEIDLWFAVMAMPAAPSASGGYCPPASTGPDPNSGGVDNTDPGYVDPGTDNTDPWYVDPGYVDPWYVDPGTNNSDPGYVDPGWNYTGPGYVDYGSN